MVGHCFQTDHALGVSEEGKRLFADLLQRRQDTPKGTIFDDDKFAKTLLAIQGRNEAFVNGTISDLIFPSPQKLAILGATRLECIVESVNEGWNDCHTVTPTRPQPDRAFGLRDSAFSPKRMEKLRPHLRAPGNKSDFKGTFYMLFPFYAKEVKCGLAGLFAADNQNAHTMTVAGNCLVTLFRLVDRAQDLHQQSFGLSVSHDDSSVRIHGYYIIITEDGHEIYRHTIKQFYLDQETKWTSWCAVMTWCEKYLPIHQKRINSVLDALLELDSISDQASDDLVHSGVS